MCRTTRERLSVEATGVVDEVGVAMGDGEIAAAIADLCANRERGVKIARRFAVRLADQYALWPPALEPDEGAAVGIPSQVAETRSGGQVAGREGAWPEAEGTDFHLL